MQIDTSVIVVLVITLLAIVVFILASRSGGARLGQAGKALQNGDYSTAVLMYDVLLKENPGNVLARISRGIAFFALGELDKAIADYTVVLAAPTRFAPLIYSIRGYAYGCKGELAKALADGNEGIRLDPKRPFNFGSRGHTYFLMGRYEEALTDFQQSAALKPDHAFALAGQAIALHALGRTDEAKALWHSLTAAQPKYNNPDAIKAEYHPAEAFVEAAHRVAALVNEDG
jgi:tetratricopeptide (TPR) repeat protein